MLGEQVLPCLNEQGSHSNNLFLDIALVTGSTALNWSLITFHQPSNISII